MKIKEWVQDQFTEYLSSHHDNYVHSEIIDTMKMEYQQQRIGNIYKISIK